MISSFLQRACAQSPPDETGAAIRPYAGTQPIHHHVLDGTGYTLPAGRGELGLWYFGYGLTDWLTIGTMPEPWLFAPLLGGYSINLSVNLGFALTHWLQLGLEAHPLWFRLNAEEQRARALIIPITAAATVSPTHNQHYSMAVRYVDVEASNEGTFEAQELRGAAVVRAFQLVAQVEWQATALLALYAQGNVQLWQQNLRLRVQGQTLDARTKVDLDGEASSLSHGRPWAAIAGVGLNLGPVTLRIGAGYGDVFVPRFGIPLRRYRGVVPDINCYVRF